MALCRGPAGTACSHWTGVRLADVLDYCGAGRAARSAHHVCFRGPKHELPQGASLCREGCAMRLGPGQAGLRAMCAVLGRSRSCCIIHPLQGRFAVALDPVRAASV